MKGGKKGMSKKGQGQGTWMCSVDVCAAIRTINEGSVPDSLDVHYILV